MEKEYYSIKELARLTGFHYNTIRNAIYNESIEAFQVNRGKNAKYCIPFSEVEKLKQDKKRILRRIKTEKKEATTEKPSSQ